MSARSSQQHSQSQDNAPLLLSISPETSLGILHSPSPLTPRSRRSVSSPSKSFRSPKSALFNVMSWKRDVHDFFETSFRIYGHSFIFLIGTVYFMQGFRSFAFHLAPLWFFRHEFPYLGLSEIQLFNSLIIAPWNIKFIYGLICDNFPIRRQQAKPYLIITSILGIIGFMALGIPPLSNSPWTCTLFFTIGLGSMAFCDVVADGSVIKNAKANGKSGAAGLQSFCWAMMFIGKITGGPISGTLAGKSGEGVRGLCFWVYSAGSAAILLAAIMMKEDQSQQAQSSFSNLFVQIKRLLGALCEKRIYRPMAWIVLANAITPDISPAMDVWKNHELGYGVDSQSYITLLCDLFGLVATLGFSKMKGGVSFRSIFMYSQAVTVGFHLFDFILVKRWNTALHIGDFAFLLGAGAMGRLISTFKMVGFHIANTVYTHTQTNTLTLN